MNYLKNLSGSLTLICVLTAAVFAGETGTPPCAPGETGTPPCSQSVAENSTDPSETNGPPSNANAIDLVTIVEGVQLALSLF